jgi:alkaline phosphatase
MSYHDGLGGILMRAAGFGADQVRGTMDNTDAYRVMYRVLFGRDVP